MKRVYANSQYAKPCERYCREVYSDEAEQIFKKAEAYYLKFMKDMPDLGENMMAKNMLDWFTILAFYEASDHRMDGETLLEIKRRSVEKMKFLGTLIDLCKLYKNAEGASGARRMDGQLENRTQSRQPYGGLLFSPCRLPHRKACQRTWIQRTSAVPLQDRSLSCNTHARKTHPHKD